MPDANASQAQKSNATMRAAFYGGDGQARLDYLEALLGTGESSQSEFLWEHINLENPDAISLTAFGVALRIAKFNETPKAVTAVLLRGFDARGEGIRLAALTAAHDAPSAALVEKLIEIIESRSHERAAAMVALAPIEDAKAREKLRSMLEDAKLDKADKIRAIALVSVTNDLDAYAPLSALSFSEDKEIQAAAKHALSELKRRYDARYK